MQDSYPKWKELYLEVLLESDEEKLTPLILDTEQAIASAQQLPMDHEKERVEMAIAKASLLAIKTNKLGWPSVR